MSRQKLSQTHKSIFFIFTVFCSLLLFSGNRLYALDYFEINNPKFRPVPVGVQSGTDNDSLFLQTVFQRNLEKTLFFQIIPETKQEFEKSGKAAFHLKLKLKKKPVRLEYILWRRGKKSPTSQGTLSLGEDGGLRFLGLSLADWFVENTLGFRGVAFSKIAYTAQKSGRRKNIMFSSYDGSGQKRFSYNLGSNNLASWSFDNRNILYTTFTRSSAQIAIQSTKRLRAKILVFPSGSQPLGGSWNPDGKSILLTLMKQGNADLYRYHLADAKLERLFAWKSLETSPAWSPDGQKIAFVSDSAGSRQPQTYIHNLANHKTERVTFRGKYNSSPKWSPDSAQLLYERQKKGFFQIYKYTLATRRHLQLTFGRYDSEKPDWSPNGKQIVFSANKTGIPKLYYMSVYGGHILRVTTSSKTVAETNPVWSK